MNAKILLAMRVANGEAVTDEELKDIRDDAAYALYSLTDDAFYRQTADVKYWLKEYFKHSNENEQEYLDTLKGINK